MIPSSPFTAKMIGDRNLFMRVHGITYSVLTGINVIDFVVPYAHCKINEVQLVNCESMDTANFEVYMGPYKLNQFGYDVVMPKDFYESKSSYDADLYEGLTVKITYNSKSEKQIGVNIVLHEVK